MNKCFALKNNNYCNILTVEKCTGYSNCSFFKTEEQAEESNKKANARLASLDKLQQKHISEKYYKGKMPWIKGGDSK